MHYAIEEGGLVPAGVKTAEPSDARLLRQSLEMVAPEADQLVAMFYHRLFEEHPEIRQMFPADMTAQRERLLVAVLALVSHYDEPAALLSALTTMGQRHAKHGVTLRQYVVVVETLLGVLGEFVGPAWTPAVNGAWTRALTFAAGTMAAAGALVEGPS